LQRVRSFRTCPKARLAERVLARHDAPRAGRSVTNSAPGPFLTADGSSARMSRRAQTLASPPRADRRQPRRGHWRRGAGEVLVHVTSPAPAGSYATLTVRVSRPATCSITVTYKSGRSHAQGLYSKHSRSGRVSWTWKVGTRTTPGRWPIDVYQVRRAAGPLPPYGALTELSTVSGSPSCWAR
jgi:hypothetical protein